MTNILGDEDLLASVDVLDEEEAVVASPVPPSAVTDLSLRTKKFVVQALLEKAQSAVPNKDIMPVLKNFQIEARPGRVRVVATDLELSVVSTSEMVEVKRTGIAVFPAKKMLEIIREAEDDEMVIDVVSGTATIKVGRTSWTLKLQNGDDYPQLPEIASVELHTVDRAKFLGALSSVRHAAATETVRPSLMMIDITDGKMTACDGVRFQQALLGDDFPISIQIPIGAVDDLVKLLRTTDLSEVGIGESDYHLVFRIGQDVFIANKLMAVFPDVENLLLQPALRNKFELHCDRTELVDAVKRVRINADPETSAIILTLTPNLITVESKDKFGNESIESVDSAWTSGDKVLVVNHKFLLEMLGMHDAKSCLFLLGEDSKSRKSPIMLKDPETKAVGLIQQMRPDFVVDGMDSAGKFKNQANAG